jgi:flagellar hook-associated protein 2
VDGNNKQGALATDSTLRMLQDDLLSAGNYTAASGTISSLAGLGVTMNNDGTLSVDSSKLDSAVQNNFADVQAFMQGVASNGFAASLKTQLSTLSDPTTGAFTVDLQSIKSQNDDLQNNIDNFEVYLQTQRTLLTAQYNQADILLQQLPNQLAQLNAMLGLTNNKQNGQ